MMDVKRSDSIAALAAALAKAQGEFTAAKFDATNPFLKSKYASLGSVIEAAKPVMAKNGLSVTQPVMGDGETISVDTILMHTSGEWIESVMILPLNKESGKSQAQAAGSVITYLRRYSLAAILGMYSDDDTDGNQPQGKQEQKKPAPQPELAEIEYPHELAVVTNSEGIPYVTLDTDKLVIMLNSITKAAKKPDLTDEQASNYSMKSDAIKQILALRNG